MIINTIFEAVKLGLANEKINLEIKDEKAFARAVFENGLVGIIVPYLDKSIFKDQEIYQKLEKALRDYIVKDTKQAYYIDKIKEIFNKNDIEFVFLKGTHLKQLYPKSYMRAMGDIDVIVKITDLDKAVNLFKKNGFEYVSENGYHIVFKTIDNIEIELHVGVVSDIEDEITIFANIWPYISNKKLALEYELVYLVKHLAKHVRSSGIGIRSIIDIEIFEKYYQDELNYEIVNEYLKKDNLLEFYLKIKDINNIIFNNSKIDKNTKNTLEYIIRSGIHGSGSSYNPFVSRGVYEHKGNKFKYYFSNVFPSFKIMSGKYKILKKIPILLPFLYVYRWITFIFRKDKALKKRTNALKDKDLINETKEVLKYFGLDD